MYGVARVAVTARQRDSLSSQQAAWRPAERHVMPSSPAATVHTGWQRPTIHVDVDARVALPPTGQLSRACTRTRAVGERQWRGDRPWPRPSDGLWCSSSSSMVCRWWRRQRPAQPRLAIVRSIWLARTPSWHRWPARASPCRGREPAAPSSGALLRRSATARAAKRRQLHQPNLGSEGRPTPRWQPLHASYAAGAADARSRAPRTLFLAAAAANCRIICNLQVD